MIEILTKIHGKVTIIVVENNEPYYFIIIYKCKQGPLSLFSYQMLASILTMDERSSYYKVYDNGTQSLQNSNWNTAVAGTRAGCGAIEQAPDNNEEGQGKFFHYHCNNIIKTNNLL